MGQDNPHHFDRLNVRHDRSKPDRAELAEDQADIDRAGRELEQAAARRQDTQP